MFTIMVFWKANYFTYKSEIVPLVGDVYPSIERWDKKHFTVTKRLLTPESTCTDLITINVEETIFNLKT